ncbi:MAG: sulfate permease, partial [Myxococcota bacterium]
MRLSDWIPALAWLPHYRLRDFGPDFAAGLTTAIMLVPQAMAYAMLAGLPPEVGLYASVVPPLIYAFLGTSRPLAVGPVAMDSLLVAVALAPLAAAGTEAYVALAVLLALMVGLLQMGMGLLKLGFLTNFLSRPVISGFTSAAALIIGLSQLKHLLGIDLARSSNPFVILGHAAAAWREASPVTLALGLGAIVVLVLLKRLAPSFPRALVVVAGSTVVVLGLDLSQVALVGTVPAGLPAPSLPAMRPELWPTLFGSALTIALVGFMEAISVSKALAARNHDKIDPSQELFALGAANLGGAFFGAYPGTGGFSRSAVNAQAGARTQVAGLVTALLVLAALLFLTPLFTSLPKSALAAIIMVAVFGLVDLEEPRRLWRVHRVDFGLLVLTFAATLGLGIQQGILTGVAAALGVFLVRSTRPHYAVLGRLPGTAAFRNLKNHPEAMATPGCLIVRFDAQFYFGNVSFLESTLERLESEYEGELTTVILDFSSVNALDSSADAALTELSLRYPARGLSLRIAG